MTSERLVIQFEYWQETRHHLVDCLPCEGCGLMAGHEVNERQILPVPNLAATSSRYWMDAAAQVEAMVAIEKQ